MNSVEMLTNARNLIRDPRNWTQGCFQATSYGQQEKYCAVGSIIKIWENRKYNFAEQGEMIQALTALNKAAEALGFSAIENVGGPAVVLNDRSDHYKVMAMFDLAIARTITKEWYEDSPPLSPEASLPYADAKFVSSFDELEST